MPNKLIARTPFDDLDLDFLLHPANAFDHPSDVVRDPDLTLNEKRAILASWASDACAVDSAPALRKAPNGKIVTYDDVVDALRTLDAELERAQPKPRAQLKDRIRRWKFGRRSGHESEGGGVTLQ